MSNRYAEQLSDPRWKELRGRIVSRDGRACVQCRAGGELHVHHQHYRVGRKPWEYRDSDLFTLCKRCHEKFHGLGPVPYPDVHAERVLLSLFLFDNELVNAMMKVLIPSDFRHARNQIIFKAMVDLYDRGRPIDQLTLCSVLKDWNAWEQIGGWDYFWALMTCTRALSQNKREQKVTA